MKKNFSTRVVVFYVCVTMLVVTMVFTAKGEMVPFLREDGLIALMQLFAAFAGVYGIMCKANGEHQKGAWYVIGGLVVAILGSTITAIAYFVLILVTIIIGDDTLWKKFDKLAKE